MAGFGAIPRLITKPGVFTYEFVPPELIDREAELRKLYVMFRSLASDGTPQNAFVTGRIGVGKTVIVRRFIQDLEAEAAANAKPFRTAYVNCKIQKQKTTENRVLLQAVRAYSPNYPDRGFSMAEMFDSLRRNIIRHRDRLVLVIDEAEILLKGSGSDLVYTLTRFAEEEPGAINPISVILISTKNALEMLDAAALSTFGRTNVLNLGRYEYGSLVRILEQRTDLGCAPDVVPEDAIIQIAELAAQEGDARYAIDLLESSLKAAELDGAGTVEPDHVRAARAESRGLASESKLRALDRQRLLVLLGIARAGRKATFVPTGAAEKAYRVACEEYAEAPRAHSQYHNYVKDLALEGLIDRKVGSAGKTGRTSHLSIPEVPVRELERQIVAILG